VVAGQALHAVDASQTLHLQFDPFELDEANARLARGSQTLALPPKAFAVLCALARRPGLLVTKEALLDTVWGHQYVSDSVLKTTISELRAALGDDARQPRFIETAARRGYRFIARTSPPAAAPVSRPTDSASPGTSLPLPQRTFIGRQSAREQLHAAWRVANAGRRQIAWVAGEAGIGKTSLIEAFVADLGAQPVAHGQCVEQHGAGEPYLPVLEAMALLCRNDPELVPLLRQVAPTWLLQLPWLSSPSELDALRSQLAGSGQERMLREFGELLDRYAQQRSLLLVTEDLHWSDQATLRLIDHVARRRAPTRLMWLASYRLAEVIAADHPLKAMRHELRLHRLVDELMLDPFSEREVGAFLDTRFPERSVPEAFSRALHAHTDGLPLFVAELIDDLSTRGVLQAGAADAWADALAGPQSVPESLTGLIERQIDRLPADEQSLLRVASVSGTEFSASTVADAAERDLGWVAECCDRLAGAGQWLSVLAVDRAPDGAIDGRYAFCHALYQQVVYKGLGATARARLHGRVAAALQRRRDAGATVAAAELARQFELGHDAASALVHYASAANSALRRFAPTEAMALTTHALTLLPSSPPGAERDRWELALLGPRLAAAQMLSVTSPEAVATVDRVEALHLRCPDDSSGLDIELGWVRFTTGEFGRALAMAQAIHARSDAAVHRVRHVAACNLLGTVLTYMGQLEEGRLRLAEGLAASEGLGDRPVDARAVVDLVVSLRCRLAQALSHLGQVDEARVQIEAAQLRAERLGPYTRRLALLFAGLLSIRCADDPRHVLAVAEKLQDLVDTHAMTQGAGPAGWLRGWALAQLGEPEAGHRSIRTADEHDLSLGLQRGRSGMLGHAALALVLGQQWDAAQAELGQALAQAARTGERIYLPDLLLLQGRIEWGLGRPQQARDAMRLAWQEAAIQQATWLELDALLALDEAGGLRPAGFEALVAARARVRQGSAAPLVVRADARLERGPSPRG
jgi:DNA-binding winged helix-turn-helix (wHTH) protein/tetratricopeptide (TPR) repeat protein